MKDLYYNPCSISVEDDPQTEEQCYLLARLEGGSGFTDLPEPDEMDEDGRQMIDDDAGWYDDEEEEYEDWDEDEDWDEEGEEGWEDDD